MPLLNFNKGRDLAPYGEVLDARDGGTIWELSYQLDSGKLGVAVFDWRPFSHFYEGATGNDFYKDYAFGAGRERIRDALRGKRIGVEYDGGVASRMWIEEGEDE